MTQVASGTVRSPGPDSRINRRERMIAAIGRTFREGVEEVGRAGGFVAESAGASRDLRTWLPRVTMHARMLGVDSLPIALFIALFTGIVLALLASYSITGAV